MTFLRALIRNENAAAAAELALCLPMVMALMFGSMEAGNYMLTEHKVIKGVRDGARYAARLPHPYYTDCGPSLNDPDAGSSLDPATDAEADIRNVTRTGALVNGANRIRGWANDEVFISVDCDGTATGIYTDVGHAPRVRVSAVVPYPSLLGSLGFDTGGVVVRAEAQAAVTGI